MRENPKASTSKSGPSLHRTIVIPDMHFPYHDHEAWECILNVVKREKPERVVWIGDGFDFFAVSSFAKSPRRSALLEDEIAEGQQEFDRMVKVSDGADTDFCEGNHEFRLERYLCEKAPELYGLISAKSLILREHKHVRWIPYRKHVRIGKVIYCHDLGFAGVYAGRHTLQAAGTNVVFGHTHRLGAVFEGTHLNERRFSLNVGWGGDVDQVDYTHKVKCKDWQLGFGWIVTDTRSGLVWPSAIPIVNGRCVVNGHVYKG